MLKFLCPLFLSLALLTASNTAFAQTHPVIAKDVKHNVSGDNSMVSYYSVGIAVYIAVLLGTASSKKKASQ